MKTKNIIQDEHFNASPAEIYDALMNSAKHAAFTGAPAEIDAKAGGSFTAHGGYITGKNLELVPGQKIVQSWHAEEDNWPDDYYSKISFELSPENGGTHLKFTHEGVPEEYADSIAEGWISYYWEPLREMFPGK